MNLNHDIFNDVREKNNQKNSIDEDGWTIFKLILMLFDDYN
jgi:hypothetical protein